MDDDDRAGFQHIHDRASLCMALVLLVLAAAFALTYCQLAGADAQLAAGPPPPACPPGQEWVQVSLGARVVFTACISAAELERAGWRTSARGGAGEVVCRTMIVRTR